MHKEAQYAILLYIIIVSVFSHSYV